MKIMIVVISCILSTYAILGAEPILAPPAPSIVFSEEIEKLIQTLGDEEFDVRDAAQQKLNKLPLEYALRFYLRSNKEEDPEILWRLRAAAKQIIVKQVVVPSDEWRQLHGCLGVEGSPIWAISIDQNTEHRQYQYAGYLVSSTYIDFDAYNKFEQYDIIVDFDGVNGYDLTVKADEEYTVKVHRYKDPTHIMEHGSIDPEDKNYQEISVKVRAGWKNTSRVSYQEEVKIIENKWNEFLISIGVKEKETSMAEPPKSTFDQRMEKLRVFFASLMKR